MFGRQFSDTSLLYSENIGPSSDIQGVNFLTPRTGMAVATKRVRTGKAVAKGGRVL
jgi:hypothetical protein